MGKGSGKGGGGGAGGGGRAAAGGGPSKPPKDVPRVEEYSKEFATDPDANPGGVLTGEGVDVLDLAIKDRDAIRAYTGAKVDGGERFKGLNAEILNEYLYDRTNFVTYRSKDFVRRAEAYKNELNAGLDKLRNYEGEVYRIVTDVNGAIAAKYTPGQNITIPNFISTSRSVDATSFPFIEARKGKTRYIIHSKRGKSVEDVSRFKGEREVVFKSGSSFHVESKVWNTGRKTWDIVLREI